MKQILIIDDSRPYFFNLSQSLGKKYTILPENHEEMSSCIEYPQVVKKNVEDFVIEIINENYKDIRLILCDIKLGENPRGGSDVVRAIRKHKIFDSPNWTSFVPIIGITDYTERRESIIDAGADFSLKKEEIEENNCLFLALVENSVDAFERRLESVYPPNLKEEIKYFKENHPNKTAFIMTSFANEHVIIANQVIEVLKKNGIEGFLADRPGGENHDDLWPNIEVFMHGCDFGIGIYADDSIIQGNNDENKNEFYKRIRINPNLSQEVGYMLGLQKKVCILKEKQLEKLPVDLSNKLYVEYEGIDDIENKIGEWLKGKVLPKPAK